MIEVSASSLEPFDAFTCFNSPYVAHDDARAIDLYPDDRVAPSPVAGEVVAVERVKAPWQPHGREYDYVVGIDTAAGDFPRTTDGERAIARLLHLEPAVEVGETVEIGDPLGTLVRAGFFAPWVDNHLHLGFRYPDADLVRAGGSLPLSLDIEAEPISWDGTGRVRATGRTFVELDAPEIASNLAASWVGLADDSGRLLDGGLPHYDRGGMLDGLVGRSLQTRRRREVQLLGTSIGTAVGPTIDWHDLVIEANGEPITGLSLYCAREDAFAVKLICPGHSLAVGDAVTVDIRRKTGL